MAREEVPLAFVATFYKCFLFYYTGNTCYELLCFSNCFPVKILNVNMEKRSKKIENIKIIILTSRLLPY